MLLLHPEVATRDCAECQKYVYDENGKQRLHRDKPVMRPPGILTDCRTAKGCPKGTPEQSREMSPRSWQAYSHYLEYKAVGCFPDDPMVRRNAAIIAGIEERYKRRREEIMQMHTRAILEAKTGS